MVESLRQILKQAPTGDPFLRDLPADFSGGSRQVCSGSLGCREQSVLGYGHGVARRRMQNTNRSRTRQLQHHQAFGPEPAPNGSRQGLITPSP